MNNIYGNVRPSLIDPLHDVEIFYRYQPKLNSEETLYTNFRKIEDVSSIFNNSNVMLSDTPDVLQDTTLPGMYNLSLPVSIFGKKGFYTVYIRPKEIYCTIKDIGVLQSYPDIRGIVVDMNDINEDRVLFGNDNLTGYRIDYLQYEEGGLKRQEYFRLITSNGFAEVVSQNISTTSSNSDGYRFNDNGSLCFITVTPSVSPNYRASAKPFIGSPNQRIIISNTKFDPVCLNIEICENDFDTIATSIDGNQIRSLDNGIVTTYNSDNEIFRQHEFYSIKDNYNTNDRYEVKRRRIDNIDNSVDQNEIFNI